MKQNRSSHIRHSAKMQAMLTDIPVSLTAWSIAILLLTIVIIAVVVWILRTFLGLDVKLW